MDPQLNTKLNLLNLNDSLIQNTNSSQLFKKQKNENDDELTLEQNKLLKFDPPLYLQRYDYVCELLRKYNCKTFMDVGAAECKMLRYLKNTITNLNLIIGLDIDEAKLDFEKEKFAISWFDHIQPKAEPMEVYLISGDITQADEYFTQMLKSINLDFLSLVELIEHLQPHQVSKCIHTVFKLIQPKLVLITTPNREFNVLFDSDASKFRHWDHKFEWTRAEFQHFCQTEILNKFTDYELVFYNGLGAPPEDASSLGHCTQLALFKLKTIQTHDTQFIDYLHRLKRANYTNRNQDEASRVQLESFIGDSKMTKYKLISFTRYPFDTFEFETEDQRNEALINEINYLISFLSRPSSLSPNNSNETDELTEEQKERLDNDIDLDDDKIRLASVEKLFAFNSIQKFKMSKQDLIDLMRREGYDFTRSGKYVFEMSRINDESLSYYSNYENSNSYENGSNNSFKVDEEDWDKDIETRQANKFCEEDWDVEMNTSINADTSSSKFNIQFNSSQISYSENKICGPFEQFEDVQHDLKDANNNYYVNENPFHD